MQQQTEKIWMEFSARLKHFILGRVSDKSVAEDILQDVFLKVHSRLDTFDGSDKIQNWLYRIARNAIIDYHRTHKTTEDLPKMLPTPETDGIEKVRQEIGSCLVPVIERLPQHYRQALKLSEIEGLPQKEVARQQGISVSGAKSRVQRGRNMVKEVLTDCCRFEFDHQRKVIDYEGKGQGCGQSCGTCGES